MTINIPSSLWEKYREAADFFIDELGSLATLIFPPKREACTNCEQNSMVGAGSSIYRKGGPFLSGQLCPVCKNTGFKEVEQTSSIVLRTYWTPKDWIKAAGTVVSADAEAMVIGYLSDLPALMRASAIQLVSDQSSIGSWRYILAGEPFPHGFHKDRYFIAFLKRSL